MITKQDLDEAIAECQGTRNPNANTCIKLAAFYIILDHLYGKTDSESGESIPAYSFAHMPIDSDPTIEYDSGTEFSKAVKGRKIAEILPIIDELMSVLSAVNPRLYAGVLRKIEG